MSSAIRITGQWPLWAVVAAAAASAVVAAALYARETRSLSSPLRWLLPLLRGLAIAMVVMTLAAPVWHRERVVGTLGQITFAVDVSQSMSVTDSSQASNQPSRLARVIEILVGNENRAGWIERLQRTHELQIVSFASGTPKFIWSSDQPRDALAFDELEPSGSGTDLSAVLRAFSRQAASSDQPADAGQDAKLATSALVLLTDGRDTVGGGAASVANRLGATSSTIHAVGLGSEQEPADVGIMDVKHPASVSADGELIGDIVLKQYGHSGQTIDVRLEAFSEVVWQQSVKLDREGLQEVRFELDVEPILQRRSQATSLRLERDAVVLDLRAKVGPIAGDMSETNNQQPFRVAASTRQRKLMIVDGSSRWEIRYLKNLFERDPRWNVHTILVGPGTDNSKLEFGEDAGQFPSTAEAMSKYDAVVLGEIPPQSLRSEDILRLREFVARGGGLIVIDGRYDRIRQLSAQGLANLIPVRHLQRSGGANDEAADKVAMLQPTQSGQGRPLLNLGVDALELGEFWEQLPAPDHLVPVEAREDAEVWAEAVAQDRSRFPWLVTRLFGSGRVFYLAADETWRWRYKVADRFHARFWNQLVAAAIQPPYAVSDDFASIGTDQVEYQAGDRATVRVRLRDAQGQPIGDATVDALLVSEGRRVTTVPLQVDDPARGTYRGLTPPLEAGQYEITMRASGFDADALRATTPIWVETRDSREFARVSLDRETLLQITEAGSGAIVHETEADSLLDELEALSSGKIVESNVSLWQSYYWLAAIMLPLTLEWLLRKRAGLV